MKIQTKLLIFLSVIAIVSTAVITLTFSIISIEQLKKERTHAVGYIAGDRHRVLVRQLLNNKQNTENLLERLKFFCGAKSFNRECIITRLKLHLDQEKVNGAIFRQRKNKIDLIVGQIANSNVNMTHFAEDQLALFANRGPKNLSFPYYVMAYDKEFGIELLIEYPLEVIQKIFRPLDDLGQSGETFLADREGYFITEQRYASNRGTHQGTKEAISANPMKTCLQKINREALDLDYREEPIIHGFRYIPEIGGGCIMAHIEQSEAFAPLYNIVKNIIIIAAVLLMASLCSIYIFARKITAPLIYLAEIAENIAKGGEVIQSQLQRNDEIGILSNRFNLMVLALKKNREEIEAHQLTIFESSKLASMGEMARGVAHEINSPLAAMVLSAEMIERKNSKLPAPCKDISKLANSIIDAGSRVENIIKGLKGFSRDAKEDGQEHFSIKHLVNTTLDLCGEMFKANKVEVIVQESKMNTKIHGKITLLSQCLFNLITNSFEAVTVLEEKWIQIGVTVDENDLEIRVTDSGKGISEEVRKKMFRPMYTTKPIGSGPGLGLSVARSIVTNLGGQIVYDDKSDHTCFIIKLAYS